MRSATGYCACTTETYNASRAPCCMERRRVEGRRVKIMARCPACMAEWFCTVPLAMAQDEGLMA